jgi:hypothetical protein
LLSTAKAAHVCNTAIVKKLRKAGVEKDDEDPDEVNV